MKIKLNTKIACFLFGLSLASFNGYSQGYWDTDGGGNVETSTSADVSCGAITSGDITCNNITSTSINTGVGGVTCSAISCSGNISCGTHIITCGAITASGAFSCGSNAVTCGGITSSGNFSNGSNTIGCGAITSGAITSSGAFSNGSNTLGCGAITSGAISSSGNITTTGVYQISGSTVLSLTGGTSNVFVGISSGASNTGGANIAMGSSALNANTSGNDNAAIGVNALKVNTTGSANSAFGAGTLATSTGAYNSAFGYEALETTTGNSNTAAGFQAGKTVTSGNYNTFLGYAADAASANAATSNLTSIGYNATNNQATNTMMFGNNATVGLYTPAGLFTTSDGRFKTNVTENVQGLAFINKLRPVTYNLDTKSLDVFVTQGMSDSTIASHQAMDFSTSTAIVHSGFIAQEVAQAAQQVGFTSSIVSIPASPNTSNYALNYAEIVVPLVKAVQELSHKVDSLLGVTAAGNRAMQNNNGTTDGGIPANATSINTINVQLSNADVVVLNQNAPNPFAEQTLINYNIPQNANSAQILFYDVNGKQINSVTINTKGQGALNVYANDLSNGVYSYTLIVDGQIIDTKKMVKQQ